MIITECACSYIYSKQPFTVEAVRNHLQSIEVST